MKLERRREGTREQTRAISPLQGSETFHLFPGATLLRRLPLALAFRAFGAENQVKSVKYIVTVSTASTYLMNQVITFRDKTEAAREGCEIVAGGLSAAIPPD